MNPEKFGGAYYFDRRGVEAKKYENYGTDRT